MSRPIIIIGPPGAGKTTLAKKMMREGDVIIDQDAIFKALTMVPNKHAALLPFINRMTAMLRSEALLGVKGMVIVVTTKWSMVRDMASHSPRVIVLAPQPSICASRNSNRGGYLKNEIIMDWWKQAGPHPITPDRVNFLTGVSIANTGRLEIKS